MKISARSVLMAGVATLTVDRHRGRAVGATASVATSPPTVQLAAQFESSCQQQPRLLTA